MSHSFTRRQVLAGTLGGLAAGGAGGLAWRSWNNGVFSVGQGAAYEPWHSWRAAAADAAPRGPQALVHAGILASNAHNTQPWRFQVEEGTITLHADPERHLGSFDPFRREQTLSLGCALENMLQAAAAQGLHTEVSTPAGRMTLAPEGGEAPAARLSLSQGETEAGEAQDNELFRAIPARHTHRGAYDGQPLPADLKRELQAFAPDSGPLRLFLFEPGARMEALGALIVSSTKAIITDRQMARDSAAWFRFDWKAVQERRDGVTLDTVGLPPLLNAAAKILPAPSDEEADRQWLEGTRDIHVATAPLLGMIAVRDLYDRPTALHAGRLWQRLHLWATARELAAQPLNQPAEMVDREAQLDLSPRTAESLAEITGTAAWRPTFLFRLGQAERPARLSPRRAPEEVVMG